MKGYLLSFASTHDGINVRMHLRNKYRFTLMPTPREIHASCGISIRVSEEEFGDVAALLTKLSLDDPARVLVFRILPGESGCCYEALV